MVNKELAAQTLEAIKANPKEWSQHSWRCSTGMCFAGHAAIISGARWKVSEWHDSLLYAELETVITPDGKELTAEEAAIDALGLDKKDADALFHGDNTLALLEEMVERIQAGESIADLSLEYDDEHYDDGYYDDDE